MLKLIIKTIGLTFYQQHTGLFLVLFYLLFGMIQGQALIDFHYALLISICASPLNLLLLFGIWTLYALRCAVFVKQKLGLAEYQFAKLITIVTHQQQYRLWFKLYAFLLIPILIYACLLIGISLKHSYYAAFFSTIIVLIVIIGLLVGYTFKITNFSFKAVDTWFNIPLGFIKKPFWTWPIFYLLTEQRLMFLMVKIVSILFFKVILWVFADIGNDVRVYLTAILAVVLSHAILVFNLIKFDAFYLSFAKSLPLTIFSRLVNWILIYTALLVPELALLYGLTEAGLVQLFHCAIFAIGSMLLLQVLVYELKADMERYLKYILFFFFCSMLAILAGYYFYFSLLLLLVSAGYYLLKFNQIELKDIA